MIQEGISRDVFTRVDQFVVDYGESIFTHMGQIFLVLFSTFYTVKLVMMLARKAGFGESFSIQDFVKPILIVSFVSLALTQSQFILEWVVIPAKSLATGLASLTASLTSDVSYNGGIMEMLHNVDSRLMNVVFKPTAELKKATHWFSVHETVGIWIIELLYIFVWFLFLAIIVEALFRFMTFYAISPMLVTAFFFKSTSSIATSGLRSLAHAVLSMFMAGVAMGVTLSIIGSFPYLVLDPAGNEYKDWVFGPQYYSLLLIALISISFHLKAPKIAANLAQIDDGAGVAATVAGLGTAGVMAAKNMTMAAGAKGARAAGGAGMKYGGKAAKYVGGKALNKGKDLYDKVVNRSGDNL